jgi:glycosyltransferase involved in cell wall biosynthesis
MKLLAVSWELPPLYGPRATQVMRTLNALADVGWCITAISMAPRRGGPHWRDGVDPPAPRAAVDVQRVASPEEWLPVRALRTLVPWARQWPDDKWVWIGPATRRAISAAASNRFDVLATFGQPWSDHLIGLRVHAATKMPWVAHFSDPWADSPHAPKSRWLSRRWHDMERAVVAAADAVVFVSHQTADLVMRKYPGEWRRKVAVVPHGYERTATHPPDLKPKLRGPMRLVYTGRFYRGLRTPEGFLQALALLQRKGPLDGRLEALFVGPFVTEYGEMARSLGVGRLVTFADRQPLSEASRMAASADVLLIIDPPAREGLFLPSKLVDYLTFAKPILGLTPASGAVADVLARLDCPIVAPDDAQAIASALAGLLQQHEAGELRVSSSYARVAEEYDIRRTTALFDAVLRRVARDDAA